MIEARETMHGIESDGLLLRLYVLNGVRSAPRFLDGLNGTLAARLSALGCEVRSRVLFPYGDWHRRLLPQIREARFDIMLPYRRYGRSIGGGRTLVALDRDRSEPEGDMGGSDSGRRREKAEAETGAVQTDHALAANGERTSDRRKEIAVFVGHSAGGVAAVHASGLLLAREGGTAEPCRHDRFAEVPHPRTAAGRGAVRTVGADAGVARRGEPFEDACIGTDGHACREQDGGSDLPDRILRRLGQERRQAAAGLAGRSSCAGRPRRRPDRRRTCRLFSRPFPPTFRRRAERTWKRRSRRYGPG
ncbi:hypothetical protein [Cohnella rhizosphaerae]|uniref:Uncharacterized protein n=1 Tax=Cohnella rhizosphaerae TaxID=1457232 RepID=A0A9X4QVY8_9BACL|nr:hypothetical protein [Cohnella rhizosphaerae]MDG0811962.1 hypothetical protein [Cohnella rhizosphaerae]